MTPEEVWNITNQNRIKDFEKTVLWNRIEVPVATIFGAGFGFCGIWTIYAVTRWGAWPVLIWITRGFREDKQRNGQKMNT